MRLPHNRGFLAGWSMGEGMISEIEYIIHANEIDAALEADNLADQVAWKERDFQESQDEDNF